MSSKIPRRHFIKKTGLAVAGGLTAPAILRAGTRARRKPNIVILTTDQQYAEAMSHRGNPWLKTPAMDRIANSGVSFGKSYCTQPLCSPSRSCLQTGHYPTTTDITTNGKSAESVLHQPQPMLGKHFHDHGYQTVMYGKWHVPVPNNQTNVHGYEEFLNRVYGWDAKLPGMTREFLKNHRDPMRPLFLNLSFHNPHDICQWARGQRGEKLPEGPIPPPGENEELPPLPDNHIMAAHQPEALFAIKKVAAKLHYPTADWTEMNWRNYIYAYYRMVEKVDADIGKALDVLEGADLLNEDTILIFWSDHGEGLAEHEWNQKQALYETTARVPLILSRPGAWKGSLDDDHLVNSNIDLYPTLCDLAGVPTPDGLPGRSLQPLLGGAPPPTNWRETIICETEFARGNQSYGYMGRMVRSSRYKYVLYNKGVNREWLVDMENDPGETNNLAEDSSYRSALTMHREHLRNWGEQVGDRKVPVPT